jgi:hypothetical protein
MNYLGYIDSTQKLKDYLDTQPSTRAVSGWYQRSIIFLRADTENSSLKFIAKRTLAIFIACVLAASLIGIPFLIKSIKEWNLQENKYTKEVMNRHNSICKQKNIDPLLRWSTEDAGRLVWHTSKGVAYLANYLVEKNDNINSKNNLKVCNNTYKLQSRLKEIESSSENVKEAIVMTTHTSVLCNKIDTKKCHSHSQIIHEKHWFAVLVEKRNGIMKVMVLDATEQNINFDRTYPKSKTFNTAEKLHFALRKANLKNTQIYHTQLARQMAYQACSLYALKDAVTFLETDNYFEWIDKNGELDPNNKGTIDKPQIVRNLPAEHIRLSQTMSGVEKYKSKNKSENLLKLEQKIEKHSRMIRGKRTNKFVDDLYIKYQEMLLNDLETLSKEEIDHRSNLRVLA